MDLKTLTELSGVSGNEQALRRAIMEAAKPLCDSVHLDGMGNVAAFKKGTGNGPAVLLAAHMDEVGFIITSVTAEGMLKFTSVGSIDPRVAVSKRVFIGDARVPGVIGAMAIHLQTPEDSRRVLKFSSLYIDIGAKTKDEASALCPMGSYVVFDTPYREFGDGFICAKALDDRVSCFTLLEILKERYPVDITCLFTAEEEVGCRGALGGAFTPEADTALVLEGTTCNDLGDVPETQKVTRTGEGVAVSFMDKSSIANHALYRQMLQLAQDKGIPCQIKTASAGGNDSGALQYKAKARRTVVLSVPCRYIHSPCSAAKYSDILAQQALVKAFLHHS